MQKFKRNWIDEGIVISAVFFGVGIIYGCSWHGKEFDFCLPDRSPLAHTGARRIAPIVHVYMTSRYPQPRYAQFVSYPP